MLKEQERKDAEAKRQEDVHAAFLKEQAQKAAIDQAATETYGKVGMRQDAMGGAMGPQMPAQPNPSMPQPDGSTGAAPAGLPMGDNKTFESPAYTQEQAAKDYQNKLMGISPKEALSNRLQAAQTTGAEQGVEKGKYELGNLKANADLGTWLSEQHKTLAEKGPVAALEANLAAYNKESVHNDGMIASIVKGADGTSSLVRTDEKTGKVKDSTPITDATAQQAIQGMAFNKWKAIPGNFEKGLEHELKSRTAGAQETSAAAAAKNAETQAGELAAKMKADLFGAQATQAKAAANASNASAIMSKAHAGVYTNMLELAKTNKEAGEAMKPLLAEYAAMTVEDQTGAKGQAKLIEAATAAARKTGDVTGIITQLKKPDRTVVSAEHEKAAYVALNKALESNDPKQIEAAKAAYPAVFGEDPLTKQLKQAIADKGKAAATTSASAPTQAIPTGDRDALRAQADQIETAITGLRQGVNMKSSPADRAASSAKIEALQKQRKDILTTWAKTPSALPVAAMPMAQP